jgi:hypothetical protein
VSRRKPRAELVTARVSVLLIFVTLVTAAPARAQYSHLLFLEAARDPGRAEVPQTARQLAMGSTTAASGEADGAVAAPGNLTVRPGRDLVFSFGRSSYSRNELVQTPGILPPANPERRRSERVGVPLMQVAAATRRGNFAAAGFFERGSRYSHAFNTGRAELRVSPLAGAVVIETGSGRAQVDQTIARLGGAVALGDARYGLGASVYAVHLDYDVRATTRVEIAGRFLPTDPLIVRCCVDETDQVAIDNWSMGFSVSGHVALGEHVSVMARGRHEPGFTSTRQIRRVGLDNNQTFTLPFDFNVNLPDTLAAGVVVRGRRLTWASEANWHAYRSVYSPTGPLEPGHESCQPDDVRRECGNFPNYETRSTFAIGSGIEAAVPLRRGRLLLRGGVAHEPGYALARDTRPLARFRSPSLPPLENTWEPPRERFIWTSAGIAYSWRHAEVGFGIGLAKGQTRLLGDLRIGRF